MQRIPQQWLRVVWFLVLVLAGCGGSGRPAGEKPNFIILFADDMGYGDWSRGGHPTIQTPQLDRMAAEGIHLTQFYSGNPVCSPSRAALMTGRHNIRTGVIQVFFPGYGNGLALDEITIAEALKPLGYTTGCIGKWHLGSVYEHRPMRQGFDCYYGLLYSNDMYRPDLWRMDERIEHPTDQRTLTQRYTEEATAFIERSKNQPFFLYVPYSMPHVPIFASNDFLDTATRGLYGDVIQELDWSVGRIMDTLDRLGLSGNTLMMFTSDNGPWTSQRTHGGTAGLLRGAKGNTYEGGMREPFIARWPGRIPGGAVSHEVGSVIDFFPTLLTLAGGSLPQDRPIDGIDLLPALQGGELPDRPIYYYRGEYLCAVRLGAWKLHFRVFTGTLNDYGGPRWEDLASPALYQVEEDPSERFDVSGLHPEVVAELTQIAEDFMADVARRGENADLLRFFVEDAPKTPTIGE